VTLTNAGPTRTVHFRLARTRLGALSGDGADRVEQLEHSVRQDADPELRARYGLAVIISWVRLTYWCTVTPHRDRLSDSVAARARGRRHLHGHLDDGGVLLPRRRFNVLWRYYYFVGQARLRARPEGVDSERLATAMRRTLPRDSSLIWQTATGVLGFVITLAGT